MPLMDDASTAKLEKGNCSNTVVPMYDKEGDESLLWLSLKIKCYREPTW